MHASFFEKLSSCDSMPPAISLLKGNAQQNAAHEDFCSDSRVSSVQQFSKKVAILLCTMRGERYLRQQLDSIAIQTYTNWEVWASDDGSDDTTLDILEEYRVRWGENRLSIRSGPSQGFVSNFFSLVCNSEIKADYYAYADQDDVWQADKLHRAVEWLEQSTNEIATLYCARTCLVDAENRQIGFSPLFRKTPGFANALVQNIGGGNTMVFNESAHVLLCDASKDVQVVAHDWWTYIVISGCGGRVYYDPVPSVQYRQHGNNLIGSNSGWAMRLLRIRMLFRGRLKDWNTQNIAALQRIYTKLTPHNRDILEKFMKVRSPSFMTRLSGLRQSGIYRQTFIDNIALMIAAALKKI
jgi:glycosyltransferase involved in cell wall biosynthesis